MIEAVSRGEGFHGGGRRARRPGRAAAGPLQPHPLGHPPPTSPTGHDARLAPALDVRARRLSLIALGVTRPRAARHPRRLTLSLSLSPPYSPPPDRPPLPFPHTSRRRLLSHTSRRGQHLPEPWRPAPPLSQWSCAACPATARSAARRSAVCLTCFAVVPPPAALDSPLALDSSLRYINSCAALASPLARR